MEPVGEREKKATLCLKFRPVEEMGKERHLKMWHVMWRDLLGPQPRPRGVREGFPKDVRTSVRTHLGPGVSF